ncbi:50S ribosomal protein L28 [Candidatus Sumerlaeota bacterium]|nr:50S ribosomal protein L28 [Candidatus Sumerlaeota bacterium]
MAKCFVCGKHKSVGCNVSHANNRTKRMFAANLKRMRVRVGKTVRREYVCASCIKARKIEKAA